MFRAVTRFRLENCHTWQVLRDSPMYCTEGHNRYKIWKICQGDIMRANHMMDLERKKFNFRTSSFSSLESLSWPSYPSFSTPIGFTPKYTSLHQSHLISNPYFIYFWDTLDFTWNLRDDISSFWSRIFRRFLWRFNVWILFS